MKQLELALKFLPYVLFGVKAIEEVVGAGKGQAKKQIILDAIKVGAAVGQQVPDAHVKMISTLIDSVVGALNASGIFKTSPKK